MKFLPRLIKLMKKEKVEAVMFWISNAPNFTINNQALSIRYQTDVYWTDLNMVKTSGNWIAESKVAEKLKIDDYLSQKIEPAYLEAFNKLKTKFEKKASRSYNNDPHIKTFKCFQKYFTSILEINRPKLFMELSKYHKDKFHNPTRNMCIIVRFLNDSIDVAIRYDNEKWPDLSLFGNSAN